MRGREGGTDFEFEIQDRRHLRRPGEEGGAREKGRADREIWYGHLYEQQSTIAVQV